MATLTGYHGLTVVDPTPTGDGGSAIQSDLKNLVDWSPKSMLGQSNDPTPSHDIGDDFFPGSLWQRTDTTPPRLFICQSNTIDAAVWIPVLLKVEQDTSPKLGGDLNANGHKIVGPLGIDATSGGIGAFESRATSGSQIVASYDGSDYLTITVDPTGATVIDSVGTSPSVTVADPFSVTKSVNSALYCQVANANVGSSAYAAHKVTADVAQAEFAAYGSGYTGTLAGTVMIGSTANVPLLFGVNSAEAGRWSTGRNLQFSAGSSSPTLASSAPHTVSLCGVDKVTGGDRRLYIQSESGAAISLGNDRLNFAASTGMASIGGTDTLWVTSGKLGVGTSPSDNLHVSGTARVTGHMAVGSTVTSSEGFRLFTTTSGSSNQVGLYCSPTCGSDCTGNLHGIIFSGATSASGTPYTLTNLYSIACLNPAVGSGSTITNLFGIQIEDLVGGTHNFGIQSQLSAGTNKWNIYVPGTAPNFFQGSVGINTISPASKLHVIDTTETCRFGYDSSNYWKSVVSSAGVVTLTAIGSGATFAFANPVLVNNPASGIGYGTGAGGTVTQATSKSTGVTLSKASGQITLNSAALAGNTTVSFTLTNTMIAATDVLVMNHISGGTAGSYALNAQCGAGSASINVRNITSGSLSEAIVIQFVVIKGVVS